MLELLRCDELTELQVVWFDNPGKKLYQPVYQHRQMCPVCQANEQIIARWRERQAEGVEEDLYV